MERAQLTRLAATILCCMVTVIGLAGDDAVIGIYFNPRPEKELAILGYEGTKLALEDEGYEDQVEYVRNLRPETLKGLEVLILSCVYGYPQEWKEETLRHALREFVADGGGIILLNESIGWRRAFSKNPPFPEIGRGAGKGDKYMKSMSSGVGPAKFVYVQLKAAKKDHPVTKDIGDFKALQDMPDIAPGKGGIVLVKKAEQDAAAVVVGTLGKGRVVLIAPTLGVGRRNIEQPPTGSALQLLLNAVKWAAGHN